ncbi:substrate-binding and VWA domain-containing protein [Streptomyces sp. NPDC005840]|uniref:substrate-binding and VWA domain-containing protein n=1 Tax=Streptomyces sp. NPDC005840 TaxID=3157072 RepID=UPI0033C2DD1F
MGRHSLPDQYGAGGSGPRSGTRRRVVLVAASLVLVVAAGTAVVRGGLFSLDGACRDGTVPLRLAASPDIVPALRAAARKARAEDVASDGRCVAVAVTARESAGVADALGAGRGIGAQVWVPDSELWIRRITADSNATDVTTAGTVASTPIGVGMVPDAAEALGWPGKTYDWAELAGATLGDDTVRLGAADPARSATGLLALTRLGAAAGKAEGGGTEAAAMMKALSERISAGDSRLLDTLPRDASDGERDDPRRNRALVLTEQAAYTRNSGDDGGLDLFYPRDGSPRLDYPYAMVGELSTDQSRAALRFVNYLRKPEQRALLEKHGFRTDAERAPERVVERAGGRKPQPYAAPQAAPAPDAAVAEALGTWTITVQSARITTVVDASSSMSEPVEDTGRSRMDVTKESLQRALATFTEDDEIGLWEFSTRLDGDRDYRVLVPTGRLGDPSDGTVRRARLKTAFDKLRPVANGATGLYDTALAAYREANSSYVKGKFNALVILTDGVNQDQGSISRAGLISELERLADPERPVPLIVIAVGPDADLREARAIAAATGGSGQSVSDPAQIQAVMLKAIVAAGSRGGG